jgi:hypothetical protein
LSAGGARCREDEEIPEVKGTIKEGWTLIVFFSSFILDSCFDF